MVTQCTTTIEPDQSGPKVTVSLFAKDLNVIHTKGENYKERLALVFGRRWWLNFIIPQFWIPNQMNEKIAKNIFLSVSKDL